MRPHHPPTTLEIVGHAGEPLACALHADGDEHAAALVLPGATRDGGRVGGSPARPDLHYTCATLRAEGFAVLEVWWDAASAPQGDIGPWLDANVGAAATKAAEGRPLALVVGRSLGTLALARSLTNGPLAGSPPATVWIAPLMRRPAVVAALRALRSPAFVVGGTADPAFDPEEAVALRQRGVTVEILEGADHGLAVADPAASARLLAHMLEELRPFVAGIAGRHPA